MRMRRIKVCSCEDGNLKTIDKRLKTKDERIKMKVRRLKNSNQGFWYEGQRVKIKLKIKLKIKTWGMTRSKPQRRTTRIAAKPAV